MSTLHPSVEVDIWCADLESAETCSMANLEILSSRERDRANQFVFALHRARFIASHAFLRTVLASYLKCPPEDVSLSDEARQKPQLGPVHPSLNFNLSHTGGKAIVGVCRESPIGVDIERIRPDLDHRSLADKLFSVNEIAAMNRLSGRAALEFFFRSWVCREAYLKATGEGLAGIDTDLQIDRTAGLPIVVLSNRPTGVWLSDLTPFEDHVAAVAISEPISGVIVRYANTFRGHFL